MLEKEYEFFRHNRPELVREHPGEFVVIRGEEILGFYETQKEALKTTADLPIGTFFVQQCIPEEESIQKYYSRVSFG